MTLFRQYFKAQFMPLVIWLAAGALLTLTGTRSAPAMTSGGVDLLLQSFPEQFRNMFGDVAGLSPVDAYVALQSAKMNGLMLTIYAVLLALGVVTREVDRRTIDFLLAQPVERRQIISARFAVVLVNTGLLACTIWAVMSGDLKAQGMDGSWGGYGQLLLGQWLVAVAVAALTLLTSVWIDDYSLGVKIWLGLVATLYFVEYVLKAANVSRWGRAFNPFSYMEAGPVVRDGMPTADLAILLAVLVIGFAWSIPAFHKKQITV